VWYTTTAADWTAIYGPITGVIGLLLWLYLSAQVLLFGAEFAAVYSRLLKEKQAPVPAASEPELSIALAQPPPGELQEALSSVSGGGGGSPVPSGTLPRREEPAGTVPHQEEPDGVLERQVQPEAVEPHQERTGADLARGTAVGLLGAGIAGGLAIVGLVATGRRLLIRRSASTAEDGAS
jgi:hypothetical protein